MVDLSIQPLKKSADTEGPDAPTLNHVIVVAQNLKDSRQANTLLPGKMSQGLSDPLLEAEDKDQTSILGKVEFFSMKKMRVLSPLKGTTSHLTSPSLHWTYKSGQTQFLALLSFPDQIPPPHPNLNKQI